MVQYAELFLNLRICIKTPTEPHNMAFFHRKFENLFFFSPNKANFLPKNAKRGCCLFFFVAMHRFWGFNIPQKKCQEVAVEEAPLQKNKKKLNRIVNPLEPGRGVDRTYNILILTIVKLGDAIPIFLWQMSINLQVFLSIDGGIVRWIVWRPKQPRKNL